MNKKDWQVRANEFAFEHNLNHPAGVYALDVMSELGEVAKELLLATNYGSQDAQYRDELAGELGDLLYSVCLLATASGIDLEEAFTTTLEKYKKRWDSTRDLGSSGKGMPDNKSYPT